MSLSYEELDNYLLKIFIGEDHIKIEKGSEIIYLVFKQPSNYIKLRANNIYKESYKKAESLGLLSIADLEKVLEQRNIFTDEDQKVIDSLESKLEAQRILLAKTTRVKAHSDRIKKIISGLESQIYEIKIKKYSKLGMSANTKAEEDKNSYMCRYCTYTDVGELYWPTDEAFKNEKDINFRNDILNKFLVFYSGIDTATIREIARSSLWRIRYVTSQKVSDQLFGVPTTEYTNDQLNLAYWSNYYQNIYEMLPEDKPSDLIIEDDEALDAYMTNYYEERNREDASRRSKKTSGGNMSAFDREEVIVTRSNELYEDIEYDTPREAQRIKDRSDVKKKVRRRL